MEEFKMAKQQGKPMQFYDSNTGNLLFQAPKGRSHQQFERESKQHGWPSFRDDEVNWEFVRCLKNGECVSLDGTHLVSGALCVVQLLVTAMVVADTACCSLCPLNVKNLVISFNFSRVTTYLISMGIGTVSTLYRLPECQILQRNL
jgi:hypothetical protein